MCLAAGWINIAGNVGGQAYALAIPSIPFTIDVYTAGPELVAGSDPTRLITYLAHHNTAGYNRSSYTPV